jgi:hypothetical protein
MYILVILPPHHQSSGALFRDMWTLRLDCRSSETLDLRLAAHGADVREYLVLANCHSSLTEA